MCEAAISDEQRKLLWLASGFLRGDFSPVGPHPIEAKSDEMRRLRGLDKGQQSKAQALTAARKSKRPAKPREQGDSK